MKIHRKFGVIWKDLVDHNKEPMQAVKVILYMPREIADVERGTLEGIKDLIEHYGANK